MLRELLEAWMTPASVAARELGYLYETIAFRERARRCADSWTVHLQRCHRAIELAVAASRGGTVVVLGSGSLFEVPMPALKKRFEKIVLIDLVHPLSVRRDWGQDKGVKLVETDLLGIAAELVAWKPTAPLPEIKTPDLAAFEPSFVISANCLSQLALLPRQKIETAAGGKVSEVELNTYCRALTKAHLANVRAAGVPHLVISDFETRVFGTDGAVLETAHPYFDRDDLDLKEEWVWTIAPRGEVDRRLQFEMSVGSFRLK